MSDLAKIDLQATGRIRENRTAGTNQKMISSKQLQKQERECFEYCCDGTLYTATWHDNSTCDDCKQLGKSHSSSQG